MPRKKLPLLLDDRAPELLLGATGKQRDRLVLMVMLMMGLRVSEVCKLDSADLDFRRRSCFVRGGKGDKDRCLPIPRRLVGPLRGWLASRTGPVFPSSWGGRLTERAVQKLVKRLARAAGIHNAAVPRKVTPHKLRHAFATRLLESGATIYEVQQLLGHSSIATTEVYLHTTMGRLTDAVDRVYR